MNTFKAILYVLAVILLAIFLLPTAVLLDTLMRQRNYSISSMFVDVWVIIRDIWKNRYSL